MMKYFIFTLGCQMNVSDSERIATILDSLGFKSASEKGADLIITNACSVRQSAVDRIWGKLRIWKKAKPAKKIILTGCILASDKKKLAPKVDYLFDIKDLAKLPEIIFQIFGKKTKKKPSLPNDYFKILPQYQSQKSALIPIMTGCNHFCSYCAVPYVRGREYSRPEKEIINEVKKALASDYQEIILLGQNVNRFQPSFVKLLKKIIKIRGNFKIKFISPNPWDLPNELINLIAKEPKIAKQLHLPVQSGDDKILRKMNRPYGAKQYLDLVNHLRLAIGNLQLSTDIIVGFPGETKKAFQNTVKLCQKAKFNKAYIAQYSPRSGTRAEKFRDDVAQTEKKRRWKILDQLINNKSYRFNKFNQAH